MTLCPMPGFNLVARARRAHWFFIAINAVHVHKRLGVHSAVVEEFLVVFNERLQFQYLSGINHCSPSIYLDQTDSNQSVIDKKELPSTKEFDHAHKRDTLMI